MDEFTIEDLRIMIGQGFGLPHLMPRALTMLEDNPLAAGDYYEGDLLSAVLQVERSFWYQHSELLGRAAGVARRAQALLRSAAEANPQGVEAEIDCEVKRFLESGVA